MSFVCQGPGQLKIREGVKKLSLGLLMNHLCKENFFIGHQLIARLSAGPRYCGNSQFIRRAGLVGKSGMCIETLKLSGPHFLKGALFIQQIYSVPIVMRPLGAEGVSTLSQVYDICDDGGGTGDHKNPQGGTRPYRL